jgi:hypothetical protein
VCRLLFGIEDCGVRDPAPEIDGSVVSSRHSFEATNRTKLSKPGCELDAEKTLVSLVPRIWRDPPEHFPTNRH